MFDWFTEPFGHLAFSTFIYNFFYEKITSPRGVMPACNTGNQPYFFL
jgi:hypothetical protein